MGWHSLGPVIRRRCMILHQGRRSMFVPFLTSALLALVIGLHLVVAWILVRKYLRTRDGGYIWLGFAVVIWPYFSVLLHLGERALTNRALTSQAAASFPFSLVQRGQMTMGDLSMLLRALLAAACRAFSRQVKKRRRAKDFNIAPWKFCRLTTPAEATVPPQWSQSPRAAETRREQQPTPDRRPSPRLPAPG